MNQNSSEKHSKKKAAALQSELISPPQNVPTMLAKFARAGELFPYTGMDDAKLRRLAREENPATGAPWIPAPIRAKFEVLPTLAGVNAYLHHQHASASAESRLDTLSFASMESCEGATGITKTLQQLAKQKGCTAFRGPRVYLLDLVRWIFREAATGNVADWGKMNIELDAKLKQVKLDTELRILVSKDEVERFTQDFAAICFGALKRLKLEAPRDFEMRSKSYIKTAFEEKYLQILTAANAQLEKLKNEQPELQPTTNQSE